MRPVVRRNLLSSMAQEFLPLSKASSAAPRRGVSSNAVPAAAQEFYTKHTISLVGEAGTTDVTPVEAFADIRKVGEDGKTQQLPDQVVQFIKTKNFKSCTPIQAATLPMTLAGRDMIGVAQTGSGKTWGFLIPLLWEAFNARQADKNVAGPLAIVLAPTRELAQQIEVEAKQLGRAFNLNSICLFGGQPRHIQERVIARSGRNLDLVVATPGR